MTKKKQASLEDIARAFRLAVDMKVETGIYNLGNGFSISVFDVCKTVEMYLHYFLGYYKGVDRYIAVSQFYGEVMKERMNISDEKLNVIHVGLDPDVFEMSEPAFDPPVIGYMSRMNEENGFEVFIDACIRLKSIPEFKDVKFSVK